VEHAIQIINSESGLVIAENLVTIEQMLSLGKAVARSFLYRCPDDNCARAMRPVFTEGQRADGKEVHSPHFRAPSSHIDGCEKDGAVKRIIERESSSVPRTSPVFTIVQQTDSPVRFNESKRITQPVEVGDTILGGDSGRPTRIPPDPVTGNIERNDPQTHTSERTSGHLRKFVEAYENFPQNLSRMPIRIRNCPARTYAETFLDVSQAVDSLGRIAGRHIYRGSYREHSLHQTGISIVFDSLAGDGKKLGIWVANDLGPATIRQELIHRLQQAALNGDVIVYVVGRFRLWRRWKYTIEVEALGEVWVSLSSGQNDNDQQP
jgi:hypothetical protein